MWKDEIYFDFYILSGSSELGETSNYNIVNKEIEFFDELEM